MSMQDADEAVREAEKIGEVCIGNDDVVIHMLVLIVYTNVDMILTVRMITFMACICMYIYM